MRYGIFKHAKPPIEVLRGFDIYEPTHLSNTLAIKSGEEPKSGMIVSKEWVSANSRYEWTVGCVAGRTPYFAYESDTAFDIVSSGKLMGLSCGDDYRIQTGYYKDGDTYNADVRLTFDGTTGDVKAATSGEEVLGIVGDIRGPKDLATSGTYPTGEMSGVTDANVIILDTKYTGFKVASM